VKISIGSDHAGYRLKEHFKEVLLKDGHEVIDVGTDSEQPVDYPIYCAAAAREVARGRAERGIVLGGSGQGEQISANTVRGIRAADARANRWRPWRPPTPRSRTSCAVSSSARTRRCS
jgi:ribose 5-phosphate isomerase B